MKSNCLFILLFCQQFLFDSVEQEDYLAQIPMRNGNITDIYQIHQYTNIDGIQDKKSDDYYQKIANVETYREIRITDKKSKSRKLLDQPVYLYKQMHLKSNDEIQQFRTNLRQVRKQQLRQQRELQEQQKSDFSQRFKADRNLSLLSREKIFNNSFKVQRKLQQTVGSPKERNLRQTKRKLTMPPMVIMFGPHMYTPEIQSPRMRINLGENKILYDKEKKEEDDEPAAKAKNIFTVNSPDYMPMGRGLSVIDVRKKWKLFSKKFLIQII